MKIYGELFIERHATLDADSCGYSGGASYRAQGDSVYRCGETSKKCNFGGGGGAYYGGGGGYATKGQTPKSEKPNILSCGDGGPTYGHRYVHLEAFMGSGGGSGGGKYLHSPGGCGGGCVVVIAGCIHNKGRITSLGQRGRYLAGSGSGGTIMVECNSYYHYGKGGILASSLEPYPEPTVPPKDPKAAESPPIRYGGGMGGDGRVAIRFNRQNWTEPMLTSIMTDDITRILTPYAWIYPIPKLVPPDYTNKKGFVKPKLIGFHPLKRFSDRAYKNCSMFRHDADGEQDGPLWNIHSDSGRREQRDLAWYEDHERQRLQEMYTWKFEEYALENQQQQQKPQQQQQQQAQQQQQSRSGSGHNKQTLNPPGSQNLKNMPRNSIANVHQSRQSQQKGKNHHHHRPSKVPYSVQSQGSSRTITSRVLNKR